MSNSIKNLCPLLKRHSKDVALKFQWKDKKHVFHKVGEMHTSHIFYALRMIWNHTMPYDEKIIPYRKHNFSSFYTKKYMIEAIKSLAVELYGRNDLPADLAIQFQIMLDYLNKHNFSELKLLENKN